MSTKVRITVTVDPELVARADAAVKAGRFKSVSAWINAAMHDYVDTDEHLEGLRQWIADFEAEFGEITEEDMAEADRYVAKHGIVVTPKPLRRRSRGAK